MTDWVSFSMASAGAAAALTGLIFVGLSINISQILSNSALIDRAFISIILLITALVISLLHLIPGQSNIMFGFEIIFSGFVSWAVVSKKDINIYRSKNQKFKKLYLFNMAIDQISLIPYIVAGILILANCDCAGYWIAAGMIFSFSKAILDSWVLLVEINR